MSCTPAAVERIREEFRRVGRADRFEAICEALSPPRMEALEGYGGFLLTPDFPAHGSFGELDAWFDRWACEPVAAVPVQLSPAAMALLYENRATHADSYSHSRESWHPNRTRVLTGVCVFVLARSSRAMAPPLQERIAKSKGRSVWGLHGPSSFRGQSPRSDRYFSLLHSADNLENLLFECELLFGDLDLLAQAIDAASPLPRAVVASLFGLCSAAGAAPGPMEPVYGAAELGLARLMGDVRTSLDDAELGAYRERLANAPEERTLEELAKCAGGWAASEQAAAQSSASARGRVGALRRAQLCIALEVLANYASLDQIGVDLIDQCFRDADVPLERWTLHRLYLYATFHSARFHRYG